VNQEERHKLNQIEGDAHRGVFSERDVCAVIQCLRERDAAMVAVSDLMDRRDFVVELHFQVSRFATQKEAAQEWGVSESYLSDVLSGWRAPGEKICKAVGYERVTMYRKVET
jgi:hypothetical protein